jgi:hypothetical protein
VGRGEQGVEWAGGVEGGINRRNVEEIGVDDSLVDGWSGTAGSRNHLSRPGREYLKCHEDCKEVVVASVCA